MPFDPSQITLEADAKEFIRRYDARCKRILSNRMVLAHPSATRLTSILSWANALHITWTRFGS